MKASDIICVDTNILIWGVKREATPGQEIMIERANYFLDKSQEEGLKFILPSLVLGEIMARTPPEKAMDFYRVMHKRFIIVPYDALAAIEFGKMCHRWKDKNPNSDVIGPDCSRKKIKVDQMIIATAIARKACCIYTHDAGIHKLADGMIEVYELPEMPPRQNRLFSG